jgi:hypothetical protein
VSGGDNDFSVDELLAARGTDTASDPHQEDVMSIAASDPPDVSMAYRQRIEDVAGTLEKRRAARTDERRSSPSPLTLWIQRVRS